MEKLILFCFATAGLSWIVVKSKLFKSFREWVTFLYVSSIKGVESGKIIANIKYKIFWFLNEVINCEGCIGFWSGILNSILIYNQISVSTISYGFAGSIVSLLLISLVRLWNLM